MSTHSVARLTKTVKKLEKPRPLKIAGNQNRHSLIDTTSTVTLHELMSLVDDVSTHIINGNYDKTLQVTIFNLCANMKSFGHQLETIYKDQLDRAFVSFRNGCRDERLDLLSRMQLLEIIELRAMQWQNNENVTSYYKQKFNQTEQLEHSSAPETPQIMSGMTTPVSVTGFSFGTTTPPATPVQQNLLSPGEVIKSSGKYAKPTKIPGKNYYKDEVVIRNSDSGKVNPGAKERLVQITGPSEEKINHAKQLIEETIRRNASPIRPEQSEKELMGGSSSSLNSSASDESNRFNVTGGRRSILMHSLSTNDANIGEYKYTVTVGNEALKITGTNLDLVRIAKIVLDEHFTVEPDHYLGAGDVFTTCDEEPAAVSANVRLSRLPPGGSQDSGATSDSEETYKVQEKEATSVELADLPLDSPPLQKPNHMTKENRISRQGVTREGSVEDKLTDSKDSGQVVVVRQPLFPDSSPEAFDKAELSTRASDVSAKNRRVFFAKTNQKDDDSNVSQKDNIGTPSRISYSRDYLLHCARSPYCRVTPKEWSRVIIECPSILKKVS